MKALVKVLCAMPFFVVLTACGQSSGSAVAPVNIDIRVRAEPESLAVGETTLIVTLTDDAGTPIDGAAIHVVGTMDHAGMKSVERAVESGTDGVYIVPFAWDMGGGWLVTVTAKLPDGNEAAKTFDFFVEAVSSQSVINRHTPAHVNSFAIGYEPDSDPAHSGDTIVTITVLDASGAPVTDAAVSVQGDMAHQGMMPVTGIGSHAGQGRYIVPVRWTMAGDWQVTVTVTLADGQVVEQVYDQKVVIP